MAVWAVLQVAAVALGAWGLGRTCVGRRTRRLHAALGVALHTALGLLVVSLVVFVQTLLGVSRERLLALTVVLVLIGVVELLRWWWQLEDRPGRLTTPTLAGLVLLAGWTMWVVAGAVLPPTGIDELIYHLDVPRRILEAGRFVPFTDNVYAYFPQAGEMLTLLGLGVTGEIGARLFHGLAGLLGGLAVYGAARELGGRRASLLAAATVLTVPTTLVVASWAYVDLHFALYAFLALVCVLRFVRAWDKVEDDRLWTWAILAGLMAGGAWATKYTGLQLTLLLLLVILVSVLRGSRRGAPAQALAVPAVALVPVAPWLVRNYLLTGWPLFPFHVGPFALSGGLNWDVARSDLYLTWLSRFGGGVERSLLGKLASPIVVFVTARFGDLTAFDGIAGPVFLLAPLAFLDRRGREVRILGTFAVVFLLYWAFSTTQVRFLLPVLPVLGLLVGVAAEGRFGRWLTPICVALVLASTALGVRQVLRQDPWSYWSGVADRDAWMATRVAGYPLYATANRELDVGDRLYLLNMRTFGYLLALPETRAALERTRPGEVPRPFPSGFRGDYIFQQYSLGERLRTATSPEDLDRFFAGMGVTHLMIDERLTLAPSALGSRQRDRLVGWLRERGVLVARNPRDQGQSLWRLRLPEAP